jgi:hypothetical protein
MPRPRKQISTRTRFEVFKRDGFKCQYCGAHPPAVILHCDHVVAIAKGGGDEMDNLVSACDRCNLGKAAVPLTAVPQSLKDKAAEVAEREAQIRGYHQVLQARKDRLEDEAWAIAAELERKPKIDSYDRRQLQSIRMFLERLPFTEVMAAAEIANAKWSYGGGRHFRYFCAVCWNKIKASG